MDKPPKAANEKLVQTFFDWTRGEQLGLIMRLDIGDRKVEYPSGSVNVSESAIRHVLEKIDSHARGGWCFATRRTLAEETGKSKKTVDRAIKALLDMSLIIRERRRSIHGVSVNHYRVVFTELAVRQRPRVNDGAPAPVPAPQPIPTTQRPIRKSRTPATVTTTTPPGPSPWDAVSARLSSCGVQRVLQVIAMCERAAITPAEVLEVCEAYQRQRGRFSAAGPGALVDRLRSGCWPIDGMVDLVDLRKREAAAAERKRRRAELDRHVEEPPGHPPLTPDMEAELMRDMTPARVSSLANENAELRMLLSMGKDLQSPLVRQTVCDLVASGRP